MTPRTPPPPEILRRWVERWAGVDGDAPPDQILEGALTALESALERPGRDREGAEALLAADALLTWAVEDAVQDPDEAQGGLTSREALEGILRRVAELGNRRRTVKLLLAAREREREQTRFYRTLAGKAELAGREAEGERLNGLLADEQHHLSRVSARLLELGGASAVAPARGIGAGGNPDSRGEGSGSGSQRTQASLEGWEEEARRREEGEVAFYRDAGEVEGLDDRTRELFREIGESEEHHARELGGKWMSA